MVSETEKVEREGESGTLLVIPCGCVVVDSAWGWADDCVVYNTCSGTGTQLVYYKTKTSHNAHIFRETHFSRTTFETPVHRTGTRHSASLNIKI